MTHSSSQATLERVRVPALEDILGHTFPVLDHGFIRVIDYMGDDSSIVQAARISYGKGTKKVNEDRGLIRYLMAHHHTTPFEMCELKVHIKMPIFIARQWLRHRTAHVNECSARYSLMDNDYYVPSAETCATQSRVNSQGRGQPVSLQEAEKIRGTINSHTQKAYTLYNHLMKNPENELHQGVAREIARMILPLNMYTQIYWKIDLHNLLNFIRLRNDSKAQWEIQQYAAVLYDIVKRWVPMTTEAFKTYHQKAVTLSQEALDVVHQWLSGNNPRQEDTLLSIREFKTLCSLFHRETYL